CDFIMASSSRCGRKDDEAGRGQWPPADAATRPSVTPKGDHRLSGGAQPAIGDSVQSRGLACNDFVDGCAALSFGRDPQPQFGRIEVIKSLRGKNACRWQPYGWPL